MGFKREIMVMNRGFIYKGKVYEYKYTSMTMILFDRREHQLVVLIMMCNLFVGLRPEAIMLLATTRPT